MGAQVSPPSEELAIATVDLRDVIDALFFRAGPISEGHAIQPGNTPAGVWQDGTHLRVLVSAEAGERIRALAQAAVDDASIVAGAITGTAELLADDSLASAAAEQFPPFTIVVRIQQRCPAGCANYGPAPLGPNAAVVTFANAQVTNGVAHELGHAFGLAHLLRPNDRPEFGFLMNPVPGGAGFTAIETAAIAAARAGGIRAGTTRDQALALDLVRPYFHVAQVHDRHLKFDTVPVTHVGTFTFGTIGACPHAPGTSTAARSRSLAMSRRAQ
jgi:hypothetical protein